MPVELILPSGSGEADTRRIVKDTVPRLISYLESQWDVDGQMELEFKFVRSHLAWRLKQLTLGGCLTSLFLWPVLLLAKTWKSRSIVKVWDTREGACIWLRPVSAYVAEPSAPAPRWRTSSAAPADPAVAWRDDLCAGLVGLFLGPGVPAWFCLGVETCFAEDKLGVPAIDAAHAADVLRFAGWQSRPAAARVAVGGQDAADLWHATGAWPGLVVRYLQESRRGAVAQTLHQVQMDDAVEELGVKKAIDDSFDFPEDDPRHKDAAGDEDRPSAEETDETDNDPSRSSDANSDQHLLDLHEFDEVLADTLGIDEADYWPALARRSVAHFQKRNPKRVDLKAPSPDELLPAANKGSFRLVRHATRLWIGAMLLAIVVSCLLTWEAPLHWIWKAAIVLGSFVGAALVGFWIVQFAIFVARRSSNRARPDT
ncbi:MAG: hypothetical protein HYS13_23725 [Planctomycetia bacterium]|nr:hypothetical protein [Planctomycetia bacterium]